MSDAWRALLREEIIDPELPIIDPHHHLWPGLEDYQEGPYGLDQLTADMESGHNIVGTVYVQCYANYDAAAPTSLQPVGETAFANAIGEEAARLGKGAGICAGIVAEGRLHDADVAEVLDAHAAAAPTRLRGVRQIACPHPFTQADLDNPAFIYDDPAFRRGFALLAPRGLTFDSCLFHYQLPELTRLARDFPETTIIIDHIGSPPGFGPYQGRINEALAEWRPHLAEIATCPNVAIKIGGQGMYVAGYDFSTRAIPPSSDAYLAELGDTLKYAIDQFGPDRCMFESNFPVDGLSSSYHVLWNAFKKLAQAYTADERRALFSGTAARIYRLEHLLPQG